MLNFNNWDLLFRGGGGKRDHAKLSGPEVQHAQLGQLKPVSCSTRTTLGVHNFLSDRMRYFWFCGLSWGEGGLKEISLTKQSATDCEIRNVLLDDMTSTTERCGNVF